MTRLRKLSIDELPDDIRSSSRADEKTPLELGLVRIFAQTPELLKGLSGFSSALKTHRTLSPRLVELVRLRVAFHNQCRSCMAIRYPEALSDGLDENLVCSLEKPMEADDLSERERLAIRFGELFATNHLEIDDAFYDLLKQHFTEPEIIELGFNVALFVGIGRFAATLNMVEELPARFQQPGEVVPWGSDAVIMR